MFYMFIFFFFKQKTAYEMRISDWSSDVCSSDLQDGSDEEVALEAVAVGDRLRVRPGEKVPVDARVEEGRSAIDESMVTGESMPVTKAAGDPVIGGTLNRSGALVVRAEKVRSEEHTSELQSLMRTSYAVFCLKTK